MGSPKKIKATLELVCALYYVLFVRFTMIYIFNTKRFIKNYFFGYSLDLYEVLSPADGHEFWMQPTGNGSTIFIQSVRLDYA
jgi:hypothetical protein